MTTPPGYREKFEENTNTKKKLVICSGDKLVTPINPLSSFLRYFS